MTMFLSDNLSKATAIATDRQGQQQISFGDDNKKDRCTCAQTDATALRM